MSTADKTKLDGIATGAQTGTVRQISEGAGINVQNGADGATNPTIAIENDLTGDVARIGSNANNYIDVNAGNYFDVLVGNVHNTRISANNLHQRGNVIAFSSIYSDERLKENIQVVDGALEKLSQISGYTFNYKNNGKASAGLIAQEVEKVLPSAVNEEEVPLHKDDGQEYKLLEYNQIIALLVESVKELKAEIEELKKHK